MYLQLLVKPNAKNNVIIGAKDAKLLISVKASPVSGEANRELIKFLSREWKISQRDMTIHRGKMSSKKTLKFPYTDRRYQVVMKYVTD
jgi:uncharacterized protein